MAYLSTHDTTMNVNTFQPEEWALPKEFECPVTREMMAEPVLAADGHSYDRYAIAYWLSAHSTSPVTNGQLIHNNLTPNHTLAALIDHHRSRLGQEMLRRVHDSNTENDVRNLEHLVEQGGNMNIRTAQGNSLLAEAVRACRLDIVQLLLKHGVDVNCTQNDKGEDLLSLAKELPVDISAKFVQLLAPIIEKKVAEAAEAKRQAETTQEQDVHGGTNDTVQENEGLLEGFPTQVNGWSIDASIGFFPSLFALMFTSWFIPTSNELPTAREHFMNNALKKLTISLVVLSILLIVVL